MNETIAQQQQRMAGLMAAITHLLTGRPGRLEEFVVQVELLVMGTAPSTAALLHWGGRTRITGKPILAFSPTSEPTVPQIALIAHVDGRTQIIEHCFLWQGAKDDRARLVPDSFAMGAFVFRNDLSLRHPPRSPARNFDAAGPGMGRAYSRLLDIEIAQRQSGQAFPLPIRRAISKAA